VLGKEHPDRLTSMANLASTYRNQGRWKEAEELEVGVMETRKRVLGEEHPARGPEHTSTLDTVHNLGLLYADQRKLIEAEKMYQRALDGYEKALGPEHTSTLDTINNLGILYATQGKLAEAEEMYQRALDGKEKALGPEHISTLDTINKLAALYNDRDRLENAEEMYQRALKGYEEAFGAEHILSLKAVYRLGSFYMKISKLESAELFFRRAMIGYTRSLGDEHSSTQDASKRLSYIRTLRRPNQESASSLSDSDASDTTSFLEDTSQLPSSLSSPSATLSQAKTEEFIAELAHLFHKDEDIRATIWRALERSKEELKFDRPRIERKLTQLLRRYSVELSQSSSASMERDTAKFIRNNSRSITIAVFRAVQPISHLQNQPTNGLDQPIEKLMLDRFLEDAPASEDINRAKAADSYPYYRQAVEQAKPEDIDSSSDGSKVSDMDKVQIGHTVGMVEGFMTAGEPFANFKRRFGDFAGHRILKNASNKVEIRSKQKTELFSNLNNAENGSVRVQWRCVSQNLIIMCWKGGQCQLTPHTAMWPSISGGHT